MIAERIDAVPDTENAPAVFLCHQIEEQRDAGTITYETARAMRARVELDLGGWGVAFNGDDDEQFVASVWNLAGRQLRVLAALFFAAEAESEGR